MASKEDHERMKEVALELFDGLARSYDRTLDVATLLQDRYWKDWVVRRIGQGRGKRLLDIGSGTLVLEERLASRGYSVAGVDITKRMIQVGQSKRLGNVALLVNGDAEALPFRDEAFDVVASCYVPKYVSMKRFVAEITRILKPGGIVAAYDFARPRGALSPFIGLYVQGAIRVTGFLMGLAKSELAYTFQNIPRIVGNSRWHLTIVPAMEANGFRTLAFESLSGGITYAYWGIKVSATRKGSEFLDTTLAVPTTHEMGNQRKGEGGQDCLPLADLTVR